MQTHTLIILTFFWLFLLGCSTDGELESALNTDDEIAVDNTENDATEETSDDSGDTNDTDNSSSGNPLTTNLRTFIFGHSLIVHDPPLIATPSNETTVPHWMAELSTAAGFDYAISGQYGFLPQHANLPPIAQWGFDRAEGAWDSDVQSFADANFNSILLTAGNFIQYQSASMPYDGDNPNNATPISATLEILDWVEQQEPGTSIYIYENWPDMAGFLNNGVPASTTEFAAYNDYTLGDFHNWWLNYHDTIRTQRPDLNVKMIPIGPIISKLLTETNLSGIPFSELYEDDAPHGRPTLYFLASLITYMGMYGVETPSDYQVPDTVHVLVQDNYGTIVDSIWDELENFNDVEGNSYVFNN
ncbi:hypothetical protein [Maribacter sp. 2308TA10-17]|uniref:hypothetical protein n=1 Tax=Maribacter sp. 2308TA10-17 TaxID=3386276 RepID=UPI0039BD06AC